MKKILNEYCHIIGNLLVGITFGFAFFYLFLNLYHYQELRREVRIDVKNDSLIASIDESIQNAEKNINKFSVYGYQGSLDYSTADSLNADFKKCIKKFRNSEYSEIKEKTIINIKDVYELREVYDTDVLTECIAFYVYPLIVESNESYFVRNRDVLTNYANVVLKGTSYLKGDLYDTSNYYFTTDNYSTIVSNKIRNSFYETLYAYNAAADLLEEISEWYASSVGGNVND